MAEDVSWFEMAEKFEALDPQGLLELEWIFKKATHEYLYYIRFSVASGVKLTPTLQPKITVMREKLLALCVRSSRKLAFADVTAESWLAQVSIGKKTTSFEGMAEHPTLKELVEVRTGTISHIAKQCAELCYRIDASSEAHGAPITAALPLFIVKPKNPFPNRAVWMATRLKERGWDKNSLYPCGGPDRKTVQKILDGRYVRAEIFKRLVDALNHEKKNGVTLTVSDIPSD
jgi:hypothetical protein